MFDPCGVPTVGVAEVPQAGFVLDVRETDEWEAGHIPWAVHIPLGQLPARVGEVPTDVPVVVACRSGARSAQAVSFLTASGRRAANLDGGMKAWHAQGRQMRSESVIQPSVI